MKKENIKKIVAVLIVLILIGIVWIVKNGNSEINDNNAIEQQSPFSLHVTTSLELVKLKEYKLPMIIDFGSDSCGPCREMYPDLKELNEELRDRAIIKFADVWANESLAKGYPIKLIPTQMLIDSEGKPYNPINVKLEGLTKYHSKEGEHILTLHEGILTREEMLEILNEMGMKND